MRDTPLYYPYVHVRDDAWLKAAALYWPKIDRLAAGYPTAVSETERKLSGELGFIGSIDPEPYALDLLAELSDFIEENRAALQKRYTVPPAPSPGQPYRSWQEAALTIPAIVYAFATSSFCTVESLPPSATSRAAVARRRQRQPVPDNREDSGFAWLRMDGNARDLRDQLFHTGLGRPGDAGWVVVASDLAALYIAALAERAAADNDMPVVTDQPDFHGILSGWDVRTTAQALIGRDRPHRPMHDTDQVKAMYAAVAIQTVIPARIEDVPVDKIIEARKRLADEFGRFHEYLNSISDKLAELSPIREPSVLQDRLELMVGRDLRRLREDLDEKLRQLSLQPAQAVLAMKSLELPAAVAAAVAAAAPAHAIPAGAAAGGMIAARFITSSVDARAKKRQARASSPAGYLLGLEEHLTPSGTVARLRRTMRRAAQPPDLQ